MVSPRARREQVGFVRDRGLSQRRACGLLGVPRSTIGYRLRQPVKDAPALAAMHRLSSQYPRYGYRRIRIFLRREGLAMSINRARRLWRQAGLGLPRKRPRRRIAASRPRPLPHEQRAAITRALIHQYDLSNRPSDPWNAGVRATRNRTL